MHGGPPSSSDFPSLGNLIKGGKKVRSRKEKDRGLQGRQQKLQPLAVLSSVTKDLRGESSRDFSFLGF